MSKIEIISMSSYISNNQTSVIVENWTNVHITFMTENVFSKTILKYLHKVITHPVHF